MSTADVPPIICIKCGLSSPCVDDGAWLDFSPPGSYLMVPSPLPVVYECATHGEFLIENGEQVFYKPDIWVEGPGGKKMWKF